MDMSCLHATIKINNMPDYDISKYRYIVATLVDGELWYYTASQNVPVEVLLYADKILIDNPTYYKN